MLDDLWAMLRRPRLQLIALGVATGFALVRLVDASVAGLVMAPLTERAESDARLAHFAGDAALAGRMIRWSDPLMYLIAFVATIAIVVRIRKSG